MFDPERSVWLDSTRWALWLWSDEMLWLASLFGLMAVSGITFGDEPEESDDEIPEDTLENSPGFGEILPSVTSIFPTPGSDSGDPVGEIIVACW
jgi:hypothetical protein